MSGTFETVFPDGVGTAAIKSAITSTWCFPGLFVFQSLFVGVFAHILGGENITSVPVLGAALVRPSQHGNIVRVYFLSYRPVNRFGERQRCCFCIPAYAWAKLI